MNKTLLMAGLWAGLWAGTLFPAGGPSHSGTAAYRTILAGPVQPFPDIKNSVQTLTLGPGGSLYMGMFGNGIHRSLDGGRSWEDLSEGLGDRYVLSLLVRSSRELLAGTARKGVFRSTDGGRSWKAVNSGLTNTEVAVLIADENRLYAGTGHGVFTSADRGKTWEAFNTGMERILVRSILLDPRGVLFAGTAGRGLFQRRPDGDGWEHLTRGFRGEFGMLENFIRTLTRDAAGVLYAGTFDGGVYISRDRGQQWEWWSHGMENQSIRAVAVGSDGTLYAGTGKGVFSRSPADAEWKSVSRGLGDDNVQSLVVDPSGRIFVGTAAGIYKGSGNGEWSEITPGPAPEKKEFDGKRSSARGVPRAGAVVHRTK